MSSPVKHLYTLRTYKKEDEAFVMATMLRGLYYGNEFFNLMPDKNAFMDNYKLICQALIQKHIVVVACLKDDPDTILGYSLTSADGSTIHFCFVKKAWRKQGIGRELLPKAPKLFSHFTTLGLDLVKKFPDCTFNPFAL